MQNEMNQHMLRPGDLLRRYCSTLALPNDAIRAVVMAVEKFLDLRAATSSSHKSQNSVAAAGIFLVRCASLETRGLWVAGQHAARHNPCGVRSLVCRLRRKQGWDTKLGSLRGCVSLVDFVCTRLYAGFCSLE